MKKTLSYLLSLLLCLSAFGGILSFGEDRQPGYTLTAPDLDHRISYSPDGKTATLFAPYVSRESGWHDADKLRDGKDDHLCWAASCSNVITWYLENYQKSGCGPLPDSYDQTEFRIFDHFRQNWDPMEGYDPLQGFAWYFTGSTTDGRPPNELINQNSGGYLKDLPHCHDSWSVIDPSHSLSVFGNYQDKFPFVYDCIGTYYPDQPLYSHRSFSETIREQLSYGACVLMVGSENFSATSGHAITLWGCDYNSQTGLVNKIYVTDSDDCSQYGPNHLKELKIKARNPDSEGIRIEGYYLPGNASPLTRLTSSTLLYAPGVVNRRDVTSQDSTTDTGTDSMAPEETETPGPKPPVTDTDTGTDSMAPEETEAPGPKPPVTDTDTATDSAAPEISGSGNGSSSGIPTEPDGTDFQSEAPPSGNSRPWLLALSILIAVAAISSAAFLMIRKKSD